MEVAQPNRVRFGSFELDVQSGELFSSQRKVVLQEQPFRVLLMLIGRAGRIATREEIQKQLWPNDTVVEFDHAINTVIGNLRRALGDTVAKPIYIETVARRGYQLRVQVEFVKRKTADTSKEPAAPEERGGQAAERGGSLVGKKVSHYPVLRVVGGGGMGLVYEAEDTKLGRHVALKFLPEELAHDAVAVKRFEREARTASALNHPHICTIYEVDEHERPAVHRDGAAGGETLREMLGAHGSRPIPLSQLLDLAVQFCEGLVAAHQKGIVHRDIKPANIFVTTSAQLKILDFGLAKLSMNAEGSQPHDDTVADTGLLETALVHAQHLTQPRQMMGTIGYMSPEQIRERRSMREATSFLLVWCFTKWHSESTLSKVPRWARFSTPFCRSLRRFQGSATQLRQRSCSN